MKKYTLGKRISYWTGNSWNREESLAYNMKIYNVVNDRDIKSRLYDLICIDGFYNEINWLIEEFNENHWFKAGFNGRSDGYLVLYRGDGTIKGIEPDEVDGQTKRDFRQLAINIIKQAIYNAEHGNIEQVEYTQTKEIFTLN